ncbi:MAG: sigma-70 family RNA polymerase sigma factor [Bacteroidales bacterium]|jgi:RNA polymerase sigma-70 factor (ECF subfamily)|nr:sigma-70 family RNA polymerase sigma factor [Bacteroidales bacterium]
MANVQYMCEKKMGNINIDALYKEFYPMVFRRCLEIVRKNEDAENAAHDVFMKILQLNEENRLIIKAKNGPGALLYKMATNFGINQFHKRRREIHRIYAIATNVSINKVREIGGKELLELLNTDIKLKNNNEHISVDVNYEQVEAEILIESILNEEDEKTRDIYFMRYRDGMTFKQIGEVVGLKKSAVEKRLKKLENLVRIKLGKESV